MMNHYIIMNNDKSFTIRNQDGVVETIIDDQYSLVEFIEQIESGDEYWADVNMGVDDEDEDYYYTTD